jgi:hypothetical protein
MGNLGIVCHGGAHHRHNYKCLPSHLSHHASFFLFHHQTKHRNNPVVLASQLLNICLKINPTHNPTNSPTTSPPNHHSTASLSPLFVHSGHSSVNTTASSTTRLAFNIRQRLNNASSNNTHVRNGRRQHNVLSGAAPLAAASLPRPTTKPPSACSSQEPLSGFNKYF